MKRKNDPREGSVRGPAGELPPELGALLAEIEKEPVPERLLELARQLQEALLRRRAEEERDDEEPARPPARKAGQG